MALETFLRIFLFFYRHAVVQTRNSPQKKAAIERKEIGMVDIKEHTVKTVEKKRGFAPL